MKRLRQTPAERKAERMPRRAARIGSQQTVNAALLARNNSYGDPPEFVRRGHYLDEPFVCQDCGRNEVWTAGQQKWWFEVAKGSVFTTAIRCCPCRRKEQARRREARRVHLEGLAAKARRSQE